MSVCRSYAAIVSAELVEKDFRWTEYLGSTCVSSACWILPWFPDCPLRLRFTWFLQCAKLRWSCELWIHRAELCCLEFGTFAGFDFAFFLFAGFNCLCIFLWRSFSDCCLHLRFISSSQCAKLRWEFLLWLSLHGARPYPKFSWMSHPERALQWGKCTMPYWEGSHAFDSGCCYCDIFTW